MPVTIGDRVTFHFTLTLADGTPVDATEGEPVATLIGRGELLECLENCLLGLSAGDRRRFDIPGTEISMQAGRTTHEFARDELPPGMDVKQGMVLGFTLPGGEEVPGTVLEVGDAGVLVDFAHPLAGRDLVFEVSVVAVESHGRTEGHGS